ncbi:hypothetical protein ACFXDH_05370 [Streptomyces sp. NPDC059467]|uniref:hypothetical protein n=1 Tax=Streptomyces sp. NPDC059467 TaxID=3346844 RepID=UPI0036BEFE80
MDAAQHPDTEVPSADSAVIPAPTPAPDSEPDRPSAQPAPDCAGFRIGSRDIGPTYVPAAPSDGNTSAPAVGDLAYDAGRDRYGVVMERTVGQVHLRPKGGGLEWSARPEDVEPACAGEALGPRVARANARSRGEIL